MNVRRLFIAILTLLLLCTSVAQAADGIDRKQCPETLKGAHFDIPHSNDWVRLIYPRL